MAWVLLQVTDFSLHLDSILAELPDRPDYDEFPARNAAQLQRQRDTYPADRKTLPGQSPSGP